MRQSILSKAGLQRFACLLLLVGGLLAVRGVKAQVSTDTLRLMHYNLCNYGNPVFSCPRVNRIGMKDTALRIILPFIDPDMIDFNEIHPNVVYSDRLRDQVLNAGLHNDWARGITTNVAGSDLVNGFFYRTSRVGLKSQHTILTPVRDMNHFRMYVQPVAGQSIDTVFFNVIVTHLKAGNTAPDRTDRASMVRVLNQYMATQDTAEGFYFEGDFNFYKATESANQMLVTHDSGGFFRDPLNRQGSWTGNASFADVHTQSPHGETPADGCHANGGIDDRFDFQLCTAGLLNPQRPLAYLPGAFRVIGNDGHHFNMSVTTGTNATVTPIVAAALMQSDHLPIMGKMLVQIPTAVRVSAQSLLRPWLAVDGLRVRNLAGPAKATFYAITGARLGSVEILPEGVAAVPAGVPSVGTLLLVLEPADGSAVPAAFKMTLPAQR